MVGRSSGRGDERVVRRFLGVKMGRIPKLVKERALKELKEQQMREEAALAVAKEAHGRESSCSSASDRSVENYDPDRMEIGTVNMFFRPSQRSGARLLGCTEQRMSPASQSSELHMSYGSVGRDSKSSTRSPIPPSYNSTSSSSSSQHAMGQSNHSSYGLAAASTSHNASNTVENRTCRLLYRTNYPTFLPDDFTADETDGVTMESTGLLTDDAFRNVKSIAMKLRTAQATSLVMLTEEETTLIR